jgi:shikimate dehydrogenase
VLILGSGGTSKTARAVCLQRGASEIITVSRSGEVNYGTVYERHTDAEVIINTTPVGTYPESFESPIDIAPFKRLSGVIDVVYNPINTPLVLSAMERGIPAEGGLYMLVMQALFASELFLDRKIPKESADMIYKKILEKKENIVLIGMPASGKTTVGGLISQKTGRTLFDTDAIITKRSKMPIP